MPGQESSDSLTGKDPTGYLALRRMMRRLTLLVLLGIAAYSADVAAVDGMWHVSAGWLGLVVAVVSVLGVALEFVTWQAYVRSWRTRVTEMAGLPAGSPLVRDRATAHAVRFREVGGRYGSEAVGYLERSTTSLRRDINLSLWYPLGLFVAAALSRNPFLTDILGLAGGVAAVLAIGASAMFRRDRTRWARLFAGVVGDVVGERGKADRPVPVPAREYVAWCEEHGLTPYPFGKPNWDEPPSQGVDHARGQGGG